MTDKRIEAAAKAIKLFLKHLLGGKQLPTIEHADDWSAMATGVIDLTEVAKTAIAAADAVDTEKQELIEALRWYADAENYRYGCSAFIGMNIIEDDGRRAREILAKHGGV